MPGNDSSPAALLRAILRPGSNPKTGSPSLPPCTNRHMDHPGRDTPNRANRIWSTIEHSRHRAAFSTYIRIPVANRCLTEHTASPLLFPTLRHVFIRQRSQPDIPYTHNVYPHSLFELDIVGSSVCGHCCHGNSANRSPVPPTPPAPSSPEPESGSRHRPASPKPPLPKQARYARSRPLPASPATPGACPAMP